MFVFAVLHLRLTPQTFWALGAAEWRALVDALTPEAMTREALAALIAQTERKAND